MPPSSRPMQLVLLALLSLQGAATANQGQTTIYLATSIPATDGGFQGGLAMKFGAELMLEEINRNPNLLPGYKFEILFQDDHCNAAHGTDLFMQNLFQEKYTLWAPGIPTSQMDFDGDGTIESEDTDRWDQVWNASQVHPRPVAYLGGSCSGLTANIVNIAYYNKLPFVSAVATFGGLSDRSIYKNFFRVSIPDSISTYAFVKLALLLNHSSMVAVTSLGDWSLTTGQFAKFATENGMQLAGDPSSDIPGFSGILLSSDYDVVKSEASQGSAKAAVAQLIKLKQRVVMVLQYLPAVRRLLCEALKRKFGSAVWMVLGWLQFEWWKSPGGECSAEEMGQATRWLIMGKMAYWRLDPEQHLTCAPNVTAGQLHARWFERQGANFGDLSKLPEGYTLYDDGGSFADAVCLYALAIHEMLFVRGFSLETMAQRTDVTYAAFQEIITATDFEGASGRVRFPPGSADPIADVKIEQIQHGGSLRQIATYKTGVFTFLGRNNLTFHFSSESAPAGPGSVSLRLKHYRTCPENERLNFMDNTCESCPANTTFVAKAGDCLCQAGYRAEGLGCVPCPKGTYSEEPGSESCSACDVGRHAANEGSSGCKFCERGSFSGRPGAELCELCPASQTTLEIARETAEDCVCKKEAYALRNGSGCRDCPAANSTTELSANVGVESCKCPANTFMTNNFQLCKPCPEGSQTNGPGQTDLSACLCNQGYFLPGDLKDWMCKPCPDHMECQVGSNEANKRFLKALAPAQRSEYQKYMSLHHRYWSSAEQPRSIFKCRSTDRCPGGSPGWACAPMLQGLACEHCQQGFRWEGERCVRCSPYQQSVVMFPIMPILMMFLVILVFYKCFGDTLAKWGSWQNCTTALLFIILNHYQILGLLSQGNITLPNELSDMFTGYQATNSFTLGFSLECVGLGKLVPTMLVKAAAPALAILATLITYWCSVLFSRLVGDPERKLEPNRLQNVLGSMMFTFFGAVSAMSLLLFRCVDNPSKVKTLSSDLSVICWSSDEWLHGLGIGIFCVVIYIGGIGALFVNTILTAPQHFQDTGFQMRWKFLFIKFHSGAYWWGVVFLAKNFFINLVPVLITDEVSKLYVTMVVVTAYVGGIVAVMPYRATMANVFELLVGVCLLYAASLLTWYVGREGLDLDTLGVSTMLVTFMPVALMPLGVLHLVLHGKKARPTQKQLQKAENDFTSVRDSFAVLGELAQVAGIDFILSLSEGDRRSLRHANLIIRTDIIGTTSPRRVRHTTSKISVTASSAGANSGKLSEYTNSRNTLQDVESNLEPSKIRRVEV